MTDHHDPLDDLASAHLDGDQDLPDPLDPDLRTRVERLATARDALRHASAPIDPVRREQAIAAALAAFDDELSEGDSVVAPLAARRRSIRLVEMAGIAAALVLLALVVPLLGRLDSGSNEDVVAPTVESAKDAAPDDRAPTRMALDSAGASTSDLGTFSDVGALSDAVRAQLAAPMSSGGASGGTAEASGGPAPGSTAPACADERAAEGTEVYAASAILDGRPVIAVVQEDQGGRTLLVLASDDCSTLSRQRL